MYDAKSKVSRLIGTVKDAVLALDIVPRVGAGKADLEEAKDTCFIVSVVDDSETISLFQTI